MNSSDRFRRLEALFHELESLPDTERDRRLAALAVDDADLHAELVKMLEPTPSLVRDEEHLDRVASDGGLAASLAHDGDPAEIGPYRLTRKLGQGGMGRVYLAEQSEPVQRQVALKLTRRGFDSAEAKARFRAERQALAVLEHPHIARVFDAGSTADGRPWFAMEYIEGVAITQWAAERGLGLIERIRLLLPVCDAIQHAHRKGLIHRDLKPSNILVVDDGGRGFPKVIDFGIARAVDLSLDERSQVTQLGELVGTPEYMSPEQAALGSIDIDTRSDVYSLGLVLYELLVGQLPMTGKALRALGFEAMCREIREGETPKPSRYRGETPTDASTGRWRARLKGDLDSVLLKALAKDRERRYGSAAELADDLKRYLDDQPVQAQPPSLSYRASKFVRRNRWPVAAAAVVSLAILSGAVIAGYGLVQARAAQAESERQQSTAEAALGFMVGLFSASDPREQPGSNPSARELLERGRAKIDELDGAPAVRARLLESLGEVYWSLGELNEARELLLRGIEEHRLAGLAIPRRLAQMLGRLGAVHRDIGELDEAEQYTREALEALESAGLGESLEAGSNLNQLAIILSRTERFDEAINAYRRAVEISQGLVDEGVGDSLITRQRLNVLRANMGALQYRRGHYAEAAEAFETVLTAVRQELPPTHPYLGSLHHNLANAYEHMGRRTASRAHAEQAVEIDRAGSGDTHLNVADSLLKFGQALMLSGEFDASEAALIESREIIVQNLGEDHVRLRLRDAQLGMLWVRRGMPERALPLFQTLVEVVEGGEGTSVRTQATYHRNLAVAYRATGNRASADQVIREGLALIGDDPLARGERAKARLLLALLAADRGALDEAERWLNESIHDDDDCSPNRQCRALDNPTTTPFRAAVLAKMGRADQAFGALEMAIDHPGWYMGMLDDPDLDPLRRDDRWRAIEERFTNRVESDSLATP